MWQLFVRPLLQFDVHRGVEGARVHGLRGGKVDVLDDVSGDSLPQLLLQYGLPESRKSAQTSITPRPADTTWAPDAPRYNFTFVCVCVCGTHLSSKKAHISPLPVCFVRLQHVDARDSETQSEAACGYSS